MATLSFSLPTDQQAKLKATLDPQQYKQAVFQIISRTTRHFQTVIRQQVRKAIAIDRKYIDRVITLTKPTGNPPEGTVTVKKTLLPLTAFKPKSVQGGVSVVMDKGKPPLLLKHAFIAIMASGHIGVFERAKNPSLDRLIGRGKGRKTVTPAGFAERLPIDEQFGPSVFAIVSLPDILTNIQTDAAEFMAKQAESQLSRFAAQQPTTDADVPD